MTSPGHQEAELILYRTANDAVRVEVLYESETFWLDQRRMAELFGVDVRTVSEHLRNVYDSGELNEEATLRKIRIVRTEGSREVARDIVFYNLDAIGADSRGPHQRALLLSEDDRRHLRKPSMGLTA